MSPDSSEEQDPGASVLSHPVAAHITAYLTHVDSITETFPLAMRAITQSVKYADQSLQAFAEANGYHNPADAPGVLTIYPDHIYRFVHLRNRSARARTALAVVPRSFVVSLVSEYDAFLGGLLGILYELKPDALKASDRVFTYKDLVAFGSIDNVKASLIEKETEAVLRKSHSEQFDWLENRYGVPLRTDLKIWPDFIELTERRNLFVHNHGIVNSQYLNVCKEADVPCDDISIGTQLQVDTKYLCRAHEILVELGVKLAHVLWRKTRPDEWPLSERYLATCILYDLVTQESYDIAIAIGEFAVKYVKFTSEYDRRLMLLNLAQAYKWKGESARMHALLNHEDWSAAKDILILVVATLKDDFDKAATLMRLLGPVAYPNKEAYREWPIFRELRKSAICQVAFEEVFGEPLQEPVRTPPPSQST